MVFFEWDKDTLEIYVNCLGVDMYWAVARKCFITLVFQYYMISIYFLLILLNVNIIFQM